MKATGFNIQIEVMNQTLAHVLIPAERGMTGFREILPALERAVEAAFDNMTEDRAVPSEGNRHVIRIIIYPLQALSNGSFT